MTTENRYSGLTKPHDTDESIYIGLMRVLRTIFEPWEDHPAMLKAYFRARTAPGGQKLIRRGFDAVVPAVMEVLADATPNSFATPTQSCPAPCTAFWDASPPARSLSEIVPSLDRTVHYLTAGFEASRSVPAKRPASPGRRRPRSADR